ncbi:MAG TPA: peptidoglycan DD-metalloendopeptidase family protein [Herpetosiphonaceae bacterium]|nr:peptidoglycan DD-metalloendopeptidase family protein [Herpetosiphonaceae bacterium]
MAVTLILLLLTSAGFLPLAAQASRTAPATQAPAANLTSLDGGVAGFLQRRNSGLAAFKVGEQPAAQVIESMTDYYNVESRIILALLETTTGAVSAPTLPVSVTERPFGAGDPGFALQIEWAAREIRIGFGPYDLPPSVQFSDGSRETLDLADDSHALTVKRFLAQGRSRAEWERLVARYPAVYDELFKDEPAVAPPSPPARQGFLSAPWLGGTRVIHSSYFDHTYPMVDNGGDDNAIMVNYLGRSGLSYNSHDGHDYYFPDKPFGTPIVAAAPGWAYPRTTRGLGVLIKHTGASEGYESVYWHLMDFAPDLTDYIDLAEPKWVERGELLGWSGATGFTDGAPHLHFEIRHNGNQVDPYGWYGPGDDPCAAYVKCERSVWLWDNSVPWRAPDDTAPRIDTTAPGGLLTINPPADVRLLAQFDGNALSTIGPSANNDGVAFSEGKWGQAARVGAGDSLTYPASPTLDLDHGALALWVNVPGQWPESRTGRHYLLAASANPADPQRIYSGTLALRHEARDGAPVWNFWTVPSNTGSAHELAVADTLSPGWHHFAISWDRDQGAKHLYIDGELAAQEIGVPLPTNVGEHLELGRWTIAAGESNAQFDDLIIYDHPLGAQAVRDLAQAAEAQVGSQAFTQNRDLVLLTPGIDDGGIVQAQLGINGVYAAPLPYYTAYRWTLPNIEGTYTVSLRLTDRMGNTGTISRPITIDYAPVGQVRLHSLTPLGATLAITATDKDQPLEMAVSPHPQAPVKSWEPLRAEKPWLWQPMGPRRVYVWFRDANGSESGPFVAGLDLWSAYIPRIDK